MEELVLCNSVKLVKIGFLNALDVKKINHWVHKKEPLHTEEDVVLVMKACTACSIYNLESVCSTTVFGHITFIMLAE